MRLSSIMHEEERPAIST